MTFVILTIKLSKKSWDVSPVTNGRTDGGRTEDGKWKIGQCSVWTRNRKKAAAQNKLYHTPFLSKQWDLDDREDGRIPLKSNMINIKKYCWAPALYVHRCVLRWCRRKIICLSINNKGMIGKGMLWANSFFLRGGGVKSSSTCWRLP